MILLGQYDSPYTRRVAISLRVLGIRYEHDTRSVFDDFDDIRKINPVGRIPALTLDDGTVLIDSAAILDWLDETAGPERALVPRSGIARREALKTIAIACGCLEKIGVANYERLIRPAAYRWPTGSTAASPRPARRLKRWKNWPGNQTTRSTRRISRPAASSAISA